MKKNDVFSLRAENLGADMEGVCRQDGMAVFVPGLLPGEQASVRIVKAEKRFAFGRMESPPAAPSSDRREPDCPAYPRCGGCSCRHMTYEATLEAKRRQVQDCFERIGGIHAEIPLPLGMEAPFAYRNKTALPVGGTAEDPVFGFYAPRSHSIVPAAACPNAMPPAGKIAAAFSDWMKRFRIEPYREEEHRGTVRHLVVRVNRKGEAMVTAAVNASSLPHTAELKQALQPLNVVSLYLNENRERTNVILSGRFHLIYGKETLQDELCGLLFELSPASFFQVNPVQTEKLYGTALAFADLKETDRLCDVYCGAGTITLMMAQRCAHAVGIEIVPSAVENARKNALRNGISNAEFHAGKAEELLPDMVRGGMRPDVIVVDPPRKGLEAAVIDAIADACPDRLVYVSCNPATLARDAALLKEKGYLVRKVQPVDMFCWTSGIETAALFTRN
ncbi:MAG: 23S rRNA (uracil(1939)-C(5))-methyltransferase RlmD [Clostridia bacterium]|nr:23S rRNA (uracil(1939)-C(5))-methyltransferase RlmD [Clostridia bacterium]